MILRAKALLAGLATWLPGYDRIRTTGGTGSARYCYSVWLRHLVLAHASGRMPAGVPRVVAELGPGDSIGIGLAALLSGATKYYALDLVRYSDLGKAHAILDELAGLFSRRKPIPGDDEFPAIKPSLPSRDFPDEIFGKEAVFAALSPSRIAALHDAIERVRERPTMIVYHAPWADPEVIQPASVDFIFSQAVLEHVDDLDGAYAAMRRWLKPTGVMSHQIDYRSHRKADSWNGHWAYSDFSWRIVVGMRPFLLNRAPHSRHRELLRAHGFELVREQAVRTPSTLERQHLARRFRLLSDEDLTTSGAWMLAAPH